MLKHMTKNIGTVDMVVSVSVPTQIKTDQYV